MVAVLGRVHGDDLVAERQLVAVLLDQLAHIVAPSSGTGKPGNGPVTELHEEKVSVSAYTAKASSYPVTMYTPCCGSR